MENKRDYYATLELDKTAKDDEIKKAYRSLAMKYHPDRNPGDKVSEEKFKEIAEAYEVLSNPEKRNKYDAGENVEVDLDSIFNMFRSRAGSGFNPLDMDLSELFDMFYGQERTTKNLDLGVEMHITLEEAYWGARRTLDFGGGSTTDISIPRGISSGKRLRFPNLGRKGRVRNGDLYVTFVVDVHERFQLRYPDLFVVEKVDVFTAVFGGSIEIKSIDKMIKVHVPPGSGSGKRLRVQGMGLPQYNSDNFFGDLYIFLEVIIPSFESMSDEEILHWKEAKYLFDKKNSK